MQNVSILNFQGGAEHSLDFMVNHLLLNIPTPTIPKCVFFKYAFRGRLEILSHHRERHKQNTIAKSRPVFSFFLAFHQHELIESRYAK